MEGCCGNQRFCFSLTKFACCISQWTSKGSRYEYISPEFLEQVRSEFIDFGIIGTNMMFKVIELDEVAYKRGGETSSSSCLRGQMSGRQGMIISMQKGRLRKGKGKQRCQEYRR